MSDFVYKKATIDDLDQILELGNLLADFTISETPVSFWTYDSLKACIEKPETGTIFCVKADDDIAGFAIVLYNQAFKVANIDQLFTLPKYRSLGIGKELYNMVLTDAKDNQMEKMSLITEFNNTSVINFFESKGFDKTLNNAKLELDLK